MDRRREPRVAKQQTVILTAVSAPGAAPVRAAMADLSGRGMKLSVRSALPEHSSVRVQSGDCTYFGRVAYCRPAEDGWHVGVEITECFTSSGAARSELISS